MEYKAKERKRVIPKLFWIFFLGVVLLLTLASCDNIMQKPTEQSTELKYARVSVNVSGTQARTIFAEPLLLDELQFTLEGEGVAGNFSKIWGSYSAMKADEVFFLEIGSWKFLLEVRNTKGTLLYTSELETEIARGDNALSFVLKEADGMGAADVTLTFPAESGIEKISAGLFNADNSPLEGFGMEEIVPSGNAATYRKEGIPAGNYILKFQLLNADNEEIFLGVMETIQIKNGRTSSKELAVEKLATKKFKYGDYGFVTMLKSSGGSSIINAIETVPKNMPASAFYWSVESDNITNLSIDEEGFLSTNDTIADYPATVKITATPKSGGEKIESLVLVDDDLSLTQAEFRRLCEAKTEQTYSEITEFEVPHGYTELDARIFSSCSKLEEVILPESIEKIGEEAFRECASLKTVKGVGLKDGELPKKLKSIGTAAFYACISLEKITIPGGVETIGSLDGYYNGVFHSCIGLKEIIIEDGVKTIGKKAFYGYYYSGSLGTVYNTAITKISIAKSVENIGEEAFYCMQRNDADIPNAKEFTLEFTESENPSEMTIGYHSFYYCHGLRKVTLPDNLKNLGTTLLYSDSSSTSSSFEHCKNLKTISFEENSICEKIGRGSFRYCDNIEAVTLPRTKISPVTEKQIETTIGYAAFEDCKKLKSLTVPGNVKVIVENAFSGIRDVTELTIEDGVETIEKNAFKGSYPYNEIVIQKINISKSVKTIGESAFTNLQSSDGFTVTFTDSKNPADAMTIGNYAFQSAKGLKSINLPDNLTSIGSAAFQNCNMLTDVYFYATTPPTITDNTFDITPLPTFYVPDSAVSDYQSAWSGYASKIQAMP